ncbi:MAG: carbohydrate-binding family 9-like protein [Armatimonadetes bacterium]|nr:carbohydrate-binding family 9-like protein [Armatimonadota bacterium]
MLKAPHPNGYVCYRSPSLPGLTGKIEAAAWDAAPWTSPFVDIEGGAKPKPTWDTRVKMLWDDDYFYVAAKLVEPHVWATLTEHDSVIFHDNDFEVFIDPDADNHQYYEYEINALGTDWDLRLVKPYRDGGPALNEWEIPGLKKGVHVQGTINDPGDEDEWWGVEIAFPWSVLAEFSKVPSPPRPGDQWRVNFSRVQWDVEVVDGKYRKIEGRPEHNWVWSPQYAVNMHKPEFWGYVQFSHMPPGTDDFNPDPEWDTRMALMHIYEMQKAYKREHGRWASTLQELAVETNVAFNLTDDGWQASINGLHVRQDSMLWSD